MVAKLLSNIGIIRFIRGYFKSRKFLKALAQCDCINANNRGTAIVVSCDGKPLIITKRDFKRDRCKGCYRQGTTWGDMVKHRITRETLQRKTIRKCSK